MKKTLIIGATCALVAAAGATVVVAQGTKGGARGPDFSQIDSDGDGLITQAELIAARDARFANIDADSDGLVTKAELVAHAAARDEARRDRRAERMIDRLDADGDSALSAAELHQRRDPARLIERLDSDGDGALSQEEMADARRGMRRGFGTRDN